MISVIASIVRLVIRSVLVVGFLLFFLAPSIVIVNHYRKKGTDAGNEKADAAGVRLSNRLVWLFGIHVQVRGMPVDGEVMIVANHISWLDIPVLHSARAMGFVSKAEVENWPVFKNISNAGGTIYHQRGNHDSASDVVKLMIQRLKQGRRVAIFPEGGILPGHSVRVFHARMFRAAVDAECIVQPVMIRYMRDGVRDDDISFRKGERMLGNFVRLLSRPGSIADLDFLPTIDAGGKPRRLVADSARQAVTNSYEA
jgi:1-acyl-sn-glycerol-3-phosphate acyltransferase